MQATFPHLALWQDVTFHLSGQSLEPVESISGAQTVSPTLRGKWMAQASFVLRGEAATLQWQAFLAQMQGRIGTALVPARSRYRAKDRNGKPLPFCDVATIADSQTWEHWGLEGSDIPRVVLASRALLRATEIDIAMLDSTGLRPGQFFSIGDRLHRVQHHWQPSDSTRLMIEPPLRAPAEAGTVLEVARPVCRMRMTTETEGLFDQSLNRMPSVTVNFMEAL